MLLVTPEASERLREVLQEHTADPKLAIRISCHPSIPNRIDLVLDRERKGDKVVEGRDGMKILLIKHDLAKGLRGMVLDYQETPHIEGFTILKPTFH